MKTFNEIEKYILKPLIEDNNKIYIPKDGKKSKFLSYLKRLGRVTRVCNPFDEIQTSYRLYPHKGSRLLTKKEVESILNLIPFREEDIVRLYFTLVEMGYSINIFYDVLEYYNTNRLNRLEVVDTLKIEGLDKNKLNIVIKDSITNN